MKSIAMYDFLDDATIHGCNRIKKEDKFRRGLWTLLVISSFCVWLGLLLVGLKSVYSYEVKTVNKYETKPYIKFPTITICTLCSIFLSNIDLNQQMQDSFLVNSDWLLLKGNISENSTMERQYLIDLLKNSSIIMDDVFLQVRWNSQDLDIARYFKRVAVNNNICFQFNGFTNHANSQKFRTVYEGMAAGLEIIADSRQSNCPAGLYDTGGLQVYIYEDEEFSESSYILLSPGVSANIALTKSLITYLPRPYKGIGGRYCNGDPSYSRSKCVRQCIDNIIEVKCPCFLKVDIQGTCDPDFSDSFKCIQTTLKSSFQKVEKRQLCTQCSDQCVIAQFRTDISYTLFPSNPVSNQLYQREYIENLSYARENLLKFNIYFKTMHVVNVQHEAKHTIETTLGTVGGQIGFYLGASVLSSIELLEVICHYGWSLLKKLWCSGYQSKTKVQPFVQ